MNEAETRAELIDPKLRANEKLALNHPYYHANLF
jgi:hypothetical protein